MPCPECLISYPALSCGDVSALAHRTLSESPRLRLMRAVPLFAEPIPAYE